MNKTCEFFEKIAAIPRPSGKEGQIANFLCEFAMASGLEYFVDKNHNVVIKKDNGSNKTIILQAHTDMVCVSEPEKEKDFEKEGIDIFKDGDFYKADGTTLGADDGIGVALILAVLSSEESGLPNIEAVFTVQEETTMLGAKTLDYTKLTGKHIISLDGVEEGVLEVSSAGMCDISLEKTLEPIEAEGNCYQLKIDGLLGGHSGGDIDKGRINAFDLLTQLLTQLEVKGICNLQGGSKINVIPSSASCHFISPLAQEKVQEECERFAVISEDGGNCPQIEVERKERDKTFYKAEEVVCFMREFKHGVVYALENGFPITSQNLGVVKMEEEKLKVLLSIRSSDKSKEKEQLDKLESICNKYGFSFSLNSQAPFFTFKKNSKVRDVLSAAYQDLYGKQVKLHHVHAGLEGGVFAENIEDLDICVTAPNVYDIHSTKERVSISSVKRVEAWLIRALQLFEREN